MKGDEVPEEYVAKIFDHIYFDYVQDPNVSINFDKNSMMQYRQDQTVNPPKAVLIYSKSK